MQVHHEVYRERLEDVKMEELVTLCKRCHRRLHGLTVWSDFDHAERDIEMRMRYPSTGEHERLPAEAEFVALMGLARTQEDHRAVENLIRHKAEMRIILASSRMWDSWLRNRDARCRLWRWAEAKAEKLKRKESLNVRQAFCFDV